MYALSIQYGMKAATRKVAMINILFTYQAFRRLSVQNFVH